MTQTLIEKMVSLPTYQQDRFGDLEPARGDNVPHWIKWSDLDAIIEEYKATEQEPFGWAWAIIHEKTGTIVNYGFSLQEISTQTETSVGLACKVIPLFTHPQLSDETVKDAERYRWLRSGGKDLGGEVFMYGYSPKGLDESIDEAMKAERETKAT